MRREHINAPSLRQLIHRAAEGAVKLLGLLLLQQTLTVGRIRHNAPILPAPVEARRVVHLKAHRIVHLGKLRVVPRDLNGVRVNVAAPDLVGLVVKFVVHRLVRRIEPYPFVHHRPVLRGKAAVQTRGTVPGDQRRLDGDGAAAAEGIAERVAPVIMRELHHRGGQRLLERSRHADGAVAALVKPLAACVEAEHHLVLHDREADLIALAGLRQRLQPVGRPEPLDGRLLHDGLAGGDGVQRGVDGIARHGELALAGDPVLPAHGAGALKERFKIRRAEAREHEQHARTAAQIDVQPREVALLAAAQHTPVFHADVGKTELFHFIAHQALEPQQAGNGKLQHGVSIAFLFRFFQYSGRGAKTQSSARKKSMVIPLALWYTMEKPQMPLRRAM